MEYNREGEYKIMEKLRKGQTFAFRLSGISLQMVEKIIKEEEISSPSRLMRKIISEFVILKYGNEAHREVRTKFIEDLLGEI